VASALVALPLGLSAQECTAEVTPAQIEAGAPAVQLTVAMSTDVGEVERLEAQGSGIAVASPRDLPRIELAAGETPAPITMVASEENTWNVWVTTDAAEPGTHRVTFIGSEGRCSADLTVRVR
jgi:hypothetical protein